MHEQNQVTRFPIHWIITFYPDFAPGLRDKSDLSVYQKFNPYKNELHQEKMQKKSILNGIFFRGAKRALSWAQNWTTWHSWQKRGCFSASNAVSSPGRLGPSSMKNLAPQCHIPVIWISPWEGNTNSTFITIHSTPHHTGFFFLSGF